MTGPIDFIIVGFEGPTFDGSILKALGDALDQGTIGLIELVVIAKDKEGNVTVAEANEASGELAAFVAKYPASSKTVDQSDIDEMADVLENDTAAGMLVIEHLWAKPLKEAITQAGGVLVADGRIHPDAAAELANDKED
jgi:hypothetical protein